MTYGQIWEAAGIPMSQAVNLFMHEVAICCDENGYPPLNAIMVNQETRIPGDG